MIEATINITVSAQKRKELLQTFKAILSPIRREPGCVYCNCYVDIEAENSFCLRAGWQTREELDDHLRSVQFGVLIGAMNLLDQAPEIKFHTIAATAGVEAITKARTGCASESNRSFPERVSGDKLNHRDSPTERIEPC